CAVTACHSTGDACESAHDCQGDQICSNGVCTLHDGSAPAPLGHACGTSGDCAQGLGCTTDSYGFPAGMCTDACSTSADCATNATCADVRATAAHARLCVPTCKAPADCRSGYTCCAALGGGCVPTGMCPDDGVAASATLGQGCSVTSDCGAGETCFNSPDFPGGFCSRNCDEAGQKGCPTAARCVESPLGAMCMPTCTGTCRSGTGNYTCAARTGSADSVCGPSTPIARTCAPPGSPFLVNGGTAGPASAPATCVRPDASSAVPFAQVQRLGTHRVNDVVSFTVPANAGAVNLVSQSVSSVDTITYNGFTLGNTVVPTLVKTPDGVTIFDDSVALKNDLSTETVYYGTSSPSTGVMSIPNTTAALNTLASGGALPAGTWQFTVNDYANECVNTSGCTGGSSQSTYDIQVIVKPRVPQTTATIDVAFYLVGVNSLTAATAVSNTSVQRMVKTLGALFANFGLCMGTVTFYDVPAWAKAKYATSIDADKDGVCDALSQMFTLSKSANSLNFFLVQDISSSNAGGEVVGIDGTIPGPSSLGGTVHSGAAVSASDLFSGSCGLSTSFSACGADRVAYIAAHEAGHWLGMYHTSEATGDSFDSLADTGTCVCKSCAPAGQQAACGASSSPTYVTPAMCSKSGNCTGGDNLMFWQLDPSYSKGNVSAQQGQVARANLVAQ
ncbi:MAG: hypothetical protein JST92_04415, partial [Deltaproteobacteria bacterium]|nr:hypothetical protein [Deltaproteobacteria bacterium]